MKATVKNLDKYLKTLTPLYDFVRGEGYFYFGFADDAPLNTPEPPESIYMCYLLQADYFKWCEFIEYSFKEWEEINKT